MIRQPVASSNLRSVGYDQTSRILEIEFNNSRVYQYFDVSDYIHAGLMSAASKGTYFNEKIKDRFPYKRIL